MEYLLHTPNWDKQCLYDKENLLNVVKYCLRPPLSKARYTIKKTTNRKFEVNDLVRVTKLDSQFYGQVGVVVMANHRSAMPYLVKLGDEHIAYQGRFLEPVVTIEYDPSKAVTVDKRVNKRTKDKTLVLELKIPSLKRIIMCFYDELDHMIEDIEWMVNDPKIDQIDIYVGGDKR